MNIKLPTNPIRMPAVLKLTGLSRSTIRTLEKKGDFPKRMYLSVRCVAWEAHEVYEWIDKKAKSRETPKCYTERKRNEAGQFVSNAYPLPVNLRTQCKDAMKRNEYERQNQV